MRDKPEANRKAYILVNIRLLAGGKMQVEITNKILKSVVDLGKTRAVKLFDMHIESINERVFLIDDEDRLDLI